jgi:hypothetical protein
MGFLPNNQFLVRALIHTFMLVLKFFGIIGILGIFGIQPQTISQE